MYICIHVCMCIYIYIYIHTHTISELDVSSVKPEDWLDITDLIGTHITLCQCDADLNAPLFPCLA